MEMYFGSKGVSNYLNVKLGGQNEVRGYEYKINMLEENNIAYLLKPVSISVDGELWLKFNTESLYVLSRFMMRVKPDGELLKIIVSQICECIEVLERYLLVPEDLVLDPEYILYNYAGREIRLIYIPGYGRGIREQLKQLLEYIMKIFDHRDYNGVSKLYSIYDAITDESFNLSGLREQLYESNDNQKQGDLNGENAIPCIKEEIDFKYNKLNECDDAVRGINNSNVNNKKNKGKSENKEKYKNIRNKKNIPIKVLGMIINSILLVASAAKYFLFAGEELYIYICIGLLTLLVVQAVFFICCREDDIDAAMLEYSKENMNQSEVKNETADIFEDRKINKHIDEHNIRKDNISGLVPLTNGALDSIILDTAKDTIVIGRGRKKSDYRVPTTQISRVHACIYKRDSGIYIEDKNSTNGTYINYVRIPALDEKKIHKGDIIGFANEEFFVS